MRVLDISRIFLALVARLTKKKKKEKRKKEKKEKERKIKLEQFDLTSMLSDTANEIIKHFDLELFNDLTISNTQTNALSLAA